MDQVSADEAYENLKLLFALGVAPLKSWPLIVLSLLVIARFNPPGAARGPAEGRAGSPRCRLSPIQTLLQILLDFDKPGGGYNILGLLSEQLLDILLRRLNSRRYVGMRAEDLGHCARLSLFHRLQPLKEVHKSRERNPLNVKIIELAASLAQAEQSELYIVHTWNASKTSRLGSRFSRGFMERTVSDIQQQHRSCLDELLRECSLENTRHQVHLLEGGAAELIPAMAKRKHFDVIVMGTVCRTGVAGFFIGNTAEKVLRQVDCSVLTVKPDTFVTPLKIDELAPARAA